MIGSANRLKKLVSMINKLGLEYLSYVIAFNLKIVSKLYI